jgi:hypothetical protein
MALLDTLLAQANEVTLWDYPIIGKSVSRGNVITTVQASPKVWHFQCNLSNPTLKWTSTSARAFWEDLRSTHTGTRFDFTFANAPYLAPLVNYQGVLNTLQQSALRTAIAQVGDPPTRLRLTGAPNSTTNVFRKGDFIQPVGGKPYTVIADASSDATGNVILTLNRPLFSTPITASQVLLGSAVTWSVYIEKISNVTMSNQYVQGMIFPTSFDLIEDALP